MMPCIRKKSDIIPAGPLHDLKRVIKGAHTVLGNTHIFQCQPHVVVRGDLRQIREDSGGLRRHFFPVIRRGAKCGDHFEVAAADNLSRIAEKVAELFYRNAGLSPMKSDIRKRIDTYRLDLLIFEELFEIRQAVPPSEIIQQFFFPELNMPETGL